MAKKKRKKTKGLSNMSLICIATIAILNLAGISYGSWTDGINVNAFISTGNIAPVFVYDEVERKPGFAVTETVYRGDPIIVNYSIKNNGSIPVKITSVDETINGSIHLDSNPLVGVELIGDQEKDGQLTITPEGDGTFTFDIIFEQWNK